MVTHRTRQPLSIVPVESSTRFFHGADRPLVGYVPYWNPPHGVDLSLTLRGIYSHVPPGQVGFDQGVSVYVDGVYMGKQFAANANLGQTQRVEVLRGPQGTLWGKNTVAGAVNIVTRKPGNEVEGGVSVDYGNRNLVHVKSNINVPLVDDRLSRPYLLNYRAAGVKPPLPGTVFSLEPVAIAVPGLPAPGPGFADQFQSRHFQVVADSKVGTQFHVGLVLHREGRPLG